jgi:hypothetical protein
VGLILSVLLGRTPAGAPRRMVPAVAVAALVFALLAPTAWSLSTWQRPANGTFPDARPVDAGGAGPGAGPAGIGFGGSLSDAELTWLQDQQTTERWILAVSSSMEASVPISEGFDVMAMGGFSGSDPAMTQDRLADLVDAGDLRFVAGGGGLSFGGSGSSVSSIVADVCEPVPASSWDPAATGDSTVFDCKGKGADIRAAVVDTSSTAQLGDGRAPGGLPGAGGFPGAGGQVPGLPAGTDPTQLMDCLSEQGVDLGAGAPTQVDDTLRDALEACGLDPTAMPAPGGANSPPSGAAATESTR